MQETKPTTGTQAIERAVALLTTIADRPQFGWRLTDLASYCDLSNPTTHRILSSLISLRLVKQREDDRRYVPGPLLYDLALTLPLHFAFQSACRKHLDYLAACSHTQVFLALRSGDTCVCVDSAGFSSVRLKSRPGMRRPLIYAAMGNAMLIGLPVEEQQRIVSSNIDHARLRADPYLSNYLHVYRRSRRCGFGFHKGDVANGVTSVSVPILNPAGVAFASLSAMTATETFTNEKIRRTVELLRHEAIAITQQNVKLTKALSK